MADKYSRQDMILSSGGAMSSNSSVSGVPGMSATPSFTEMNSSKQLFGAQVVKGTLDYMNSGSAAGPKAGSDYDFQTKVLEAGLMAKGIGYQGKV